MQNNTYGTAWRGARALAAGAIATVIMVNGDAAQAADGRSVGISGNSVFSDCGSAGSDFALLMTGDLEGCLSIFVKSYTCKEVNGFARYIERGREVFVGKMRGKQGRFATTYKVDAAYAQGFCESFDFTLELSGSCVHKIEGRSGVFAGGVGIYTMFDVITNVTGDPATGTFAAGSGANNFLYAGYIDFESTSVSPGDMAAADEMMAGVAASDGTTGRKPRRAC
jgi:hypothetical protein